MSNKLKEGCNLFADLIEAMPAAFAKEAYGRDANGKDLFDWKVGREDGAINHPDAVSWCAVGGVAAAAEVPYRDARTFLNPFTAPMSPERFNNAKGRTAVIEMLRRAAA